MSGVSSQQLWILTEGGRIVVQRDIRASCNQERDRHTTGLVRTFGYLVPEYVNMGRANRDSDVYGCGVVSSEIARATNNFSNERKFSETAPVLVSETETLRSMNDDSSERGAGDRRFSYPDLAKATNNFCNESKLGEGGFGAVYLGYLIS